MLVVGTVSSLSSSYLQSILSTALQNTSSTSSNTGSSSSVDQLFSQSQDSSQLSPFAQLMSTLQQLQQSDPSKYQDVTSQIATNLQDAAKTATSDGHTSLANQLNTLATDFTNASQNGTLPNIQDLARAVEGGHHHMHGHHGGPPPGPPPDADSSSTTSSSSSSSSSTTSTAGSTAASATDLLKQLLASFEAPQSQSSALNPMSIITNTLENAGITGTSSS